MPKACSDRHPETADAGERRRHGARAKPSGLARAIEHGRAKRRRAGRQLSTSRKGSDRAGRTELMPKLAEACVESGSGLVLRENPPGRLLIASPYSGGAIRREVWNAFVSFGFGGLMLF